MDTSVIISDICNKIILRRDIIRYLSKYNIIQNIEQYVNDIYTSSKNKEKYITFLIPIEFDVHLANDISSRITSELITRPLIFKSAVQDIMHNLICTILENETIQISQVISSVIPQPLYLIQNNQLKGLSTFQGVLTQYSTQQKYIRNSVWECSCHNEVPVFISEVPSCIPQCELCGNILKEQVAYRNTGDFIVCLFINIKSLQMKKCRNRYETVKVQLNDINADILELGAIYNMVGYHEKIFLAWHCEKQTSRPFYLQNSIHFKSNKIFEMFSCLSESPWKFTYMLAIHIAHEIYPLFSFINFKMGLLLSLASLNTKSVPIPILAIGDNTITAHLIFDCAGNYAERCIHSTSNSTLCGQKNGNDVYEAGTLVLSRGGVCYLGDWEKYGKEKSSSIIQTAIEYNQINIETNILPLQSAVWTYLKKPYKNKDKIKLQTLINVFGIPLTCDAEDSENSVINFILLKSIDGQRVSTNLANFSDKDFCQFLFCIQNIDVSLTDEAQQLLMDYFVVSRRVRPGCLPVGALRFLNSLSESHARLNLRNKVIVEDVVAVISVYEESMQQVFGVSDVAPAYIKNICDINEVDDEMQKFHSWLTEYVSITNIRNTYNSSNGND